jgi:hypothetical protein
LQARFIAEAIHLYKMLKIVVVVIILGAGFVCLQRLVLVFGGQQQLC